MVVARGRIVAVSPVEDGRFWSLVPRRALHGREPNVYAVQP